MTSYDLVNHIGHVGFREIHPPRSELRGRAPFDAHIDTIVQRDVQDIARIGHPSELSPPYRLARIATIGYGALTTSYPYNLKPCPPLQAFDVSASLNSICSPFS